MKTAELKIGGGDKGFIKVPAPLPETEEELKTLAKGDPKVLLRWATRGLRIELQERSGARDAFKEGKSAEEVAKLVAEYDPTKVIPRTGRPKGPKEVKLSVPKGKKTFTLEDFKAALVSQGINVTVSETA